MEIFWNWDGFQYLDFALKSIIITFIWKKILLEQEDSYLDKIMAAGFDGVYLDIIDAFEYWE
ncbi:MAG: hypothetical protein J7L96_00635 [Bacteroidales bacterium]|nr:hypothetical protein [Bacteroidales bacterium]